MLKLFTLSSAIKLLNKRFLTTTNVKYQQLIENVRITDHETLQVKFQNGTSCQFKNIWLRDSCQCGECVDSITKHKLFEIPYNDINVKANVIETKTDQITIQWSNSDEQKMHKSHYKAEWLNQFVSVFESANKRAIKDVLYNSPLPAHQPWDRQTIQEINLNVNYQSYMSEDKGLFKVLENVHKYGLAIIKDVPPVQHQVVDVCNRITFVKETGYGRTFQIKINPHPKTHLTYTGKRFNLHSDLSYFHNAPGAQLIHCLVAADPSTVGQQSAGGISFFSDGLKAIEWLRNQHPDYYQLLTTVKVPFSYLDAQRNRWIRHDRCLIETDSSSNPTHFYCNDFSMRPPLIPNDKIVPFYQAYHSLIGKMNEAESLFEFFLTSGDLVVFNNKRILHGRDEYNPALVDRHLEGCYMDLQELTSLYEKMLGELNQ